MLNSRDKKINFRDSFFAQIGERVSQSADLLFIREVQTGSVFTYGQFWDLVEQKSSLIASSFPNLKAGDRVLVQLANDIEASACLLALLKSKLIPVSLGLQSTEIETQRLASLSGASLILDSSEPSNSQLVDLDPKFTLNEQTASWVKGESLAIILYTSGSTGEPKGVMITYQNILAQIEGAALAMGVQEGEKILGVLRFSHVFGLLDVLLLALSRGLSIELLANFKAPQALEAAKNCEIILAVPTMYSLMVRQLERKNLMFPTLRVCHSGAAAMSEALAQKIEKYFGAPVQEGYGLTESCSMAFSNPLLGSRLGSVGQLISGLESELGELDPATGLGEVWLRGATISPGYFNGSSSMGAGAWFQTGDFGRFEDGYLYLAGRVDDLIGRAGQKVYPREIEVVLEGHEQVIECAVVGIEESLAGQKILAFIVTAATNQDKLRQELLALCKLSLSEFKIPSSFHFCSDLPKTASGKIQRHRLRSLPR